MASHFGPRSSLMTEVSSALFQSTIRKWVVVHGRFSGPLRLSRVVGYAVRAGTRGKASLFRGEESSPMKDTVIERIDDSNWEEFFSSSLAVLVLSRSSCPHCKKWVETLRAFSSEEWGEVRFGSIDLEGPGVEQFKDRNEWLDQVEFLPFTIIIRIFRRIVI